MNTVPVRARSLRSGSARSGSARSSDAASERARTAGSWLAFSALALYGTLRWNTMLPGGEQGRMFLALGVALLSAAALRHLPGGRHPYGLFALVVLLSLATILAIAGYPVHALVSLHLHRLGTTIGHGVATLGGVLVPYDGADPATTYVLILGAAVLLLAAGLAFGTVRAAPATGQLALAALPLVVLATVPSAIVTPRLVYFHGLLTFVLGALLVFSPRLLRERRGAAGVMLACATVIGAVGAGLIAGSHVWLSVSDQHATAGAAGAIEQFDWQQTYGQQAWPHAGNTVLTVTARRPAYWKAEDLPAFNGVAWTTAASSFDGLTGVSAATIAADSETIGVSVGQMTSKPVIAAGYAGPPDLVGAMPGSDPGTWITSLMLQPGDNYQVRVYVPDPSMVQLADAGSVYPRGLERYRVLTRLAPAYAGVEALARQLAVGTDTPYEYVEAVLAYLRREDVYTLDPPAGGSYPLADFLLRSHRGYCQQFAGAMALLLRLHGVPAQVAVGFSSGQREKGTHTYRVSDRDAHAWVEVWFPGYGWVTFDPTPGVASGGGANSAPNDHADGAGAGAGSGTTAAGRAARAAADSGHGHRRLIGPEAGTGATGAVHARAGFDASTVARVLATLLAGVLLGLMVLGARAYLRRPTAEELTAELERAFARTGHPLSDDVTLAALGRRLSDSPAAAAYVSALAAMRYQPSGTAPTARGRAALRRWLAQGHGTAGWVQAAWALPPRRWPRVDP